MSVRSSVSRGCFLFAMGASLLASCQQGNGEPLERYPDLASVEEWVAPEPGEVPEGSPVALHGKLRVDGQARLAHHLGFFAKLI